MLWNCLLLKVELNSMGCNSCHFNMGLTLLIRINKKFVKETFFRRNEGGGDNCLCGKLSCPPSFLFYTVIEVLLGPLSLTDLTPVFPTIPVTNVVPATIILVETLHGSHVVRALWEGQTWRGWLICVVNIEEWEGQRQRHRCTSVGFCPPLTTRDDRRAVWGPNGEINLLIKLLQEIL